MPHHATHSATLTTAALLALAAAGCDSATESATATSALSAEAEQTGNASRLDAAYLEGTWCYAYVDFGGGNQEPVQKAYRFHGDGSLEHQISETSDTMKPGSYEISDGVIEIRPSLEMFTLQIASVSDDEFVLRAMGGGHHFQRGQCEG